MRQLTNYILQKENEKKVFSNFLLNMNYEICLFFTGKKPLRLTEKVLV